MARVFSDKNEKRSRKRTSWSGLRPSAAFAAPRARRSRPTREKSKELADFKVSEDEGEDLGRVERLLYVLAAVITVVIYSQRRTEPVINQRQSTFAFLSKVSIRLGSLLRSAFLCSGGFQLFLYEVPSLIERVLPV